MATKIESLTIVNQQGTKRYAVGDICDDLLIHEIIDESESDSESFFVSIYRGKTSCGELVFEAINAPIDVSYTAA